MKSYDSATTPQKKNYHLPLQHHNHTNSTTTRSSNHPKPMVTLVSIVSTPSGVSSLAPLILCPVDIISRVGRTGISITLIPLRSTFIFSSISLFQSLGNLSSASTSMMISISLRYLYISLTSMLLLFCSSFKSCLIPFRSL